MPEDRFDAVVVGAGFAGLYMLHKLRKLGLAVRVFEAGDGVGGTWYWNRYPGARCDVESIEYSYGFDEDLEQEWEWTERYATQPEILRYLEHVADRFDLRRDIRFNTRVASATFDDDANRWTVRTESGDEVTSQFLIMATGCLSAANMPVFPGQDSYEGRILHTGQWPHEPVDLSGLRVGVIGTGSSAIQSIPIMAEQAEELVVFQRTASYSVPAHNRKLEAEELALAKKHYRNLRQANRQSMVGFGGWQTPAEHSAVAVDDATRQEILDQRWARGGLSFLGGFTDALLLPEANEKVADYVRDKIRTIVKDPDVAAKLSPTQVIGCKRLCVDTGYYETYNRDNVRLVDINEDPIEALTTSGIKTKYESFDFDVIVFATGFDAMTGALMRVDIRGTDGITLKEAWAEGPKTYLGLSTPRFPNMFMITGPGSPSVLTNMVTSIEQHVEWISDCITYVGNLGRIEATPEAAEAWVDHVNMIASFSLFPTCNSWYLGANIPGKKRVFMPLLGFQPYDVKCQEVAANGYEGFAVTAGARR
jgi:cation diffusion facilitator CzcD-associated flavoprotein CzcO